ncbi:RecE family exodeoxyribonuclease [Mangrovibacter phragmitis]|uniref:RecE family exodeoxyribonuclease n=1 Tax=Mangrovibacter phragmitis TaxID=1691903 RepID=UPI00336A523D
MEFFYVVKATQKSGKDDAVIWFTAKSEARANLQLDVELEEAGIETGRGKDYQKPIRTDLPVYDDLPEENTVDYTWSTRYQLGDDGLTWHKIPTADNTVNTGQTDTVINEQADVPATNEDLPELISVCTLPFRHKVIAEFLAGDEYFYHITAEQKREVLKLEMDTDNTYVQNLVLAVNCVADIQKAREYDIWQLTSAIKRIWPTDGKVPELGNVRQFIETWSKTENIDRGILTNEWAKGNHIAAIQRTDAGLNAGGGNKTDRNPDLIHTLDTLDIEIALATLPMDFDIYDIPGSVFRRSKEVVSKKESPFKEWSAALRRTPGILDYSRAAIFALIRSADEGLHNFPGNLQSYIVANLTEFKHETPTAEVLAAARHIPQASVALDVIEGKRPAEELETVTGEMEVATRQIMSEAKSRAESAHQPQVSSLGNGVFSIDGLAATSTTQETTSNVPMETTHHDQVTSSAQVSENESADEVDAQANTLSTGSFPEAAAAFNEATKGLAAVMAVEKQVAQHETQETTREEAQPEYPAYFEPGRYEGLPNEVYHAANGISSTQVKDARVSLMYFDARHVSKTIQKERSKVLDMGNLVHGLALQPENLQAEFSIEPEIPEGAFTTTATIRAFIDEHNASLPAQLSADDIKALLEEYNATLPAQVSLGGSVEETGQSYMSLPVEFQRIEEGQKQTAAAMKACIKEYNSTLPAQVKTNGSRDALLEQLAIINPDLVAQEAQKPAPLKVSGTKADMIAAVKSVNPDAVFADELLDAWRDNPEGKILVTRQQYATALQMQQALFSHPTAGKLLQHPDRAVEVSYFGIDEETGLEIRVRPDLEIDMNSVRIGADLKTISMWNIKREAIRAKLHREIIERDYHLSAAMYCETAGLDQFFWIFINKDEGYHWIAIIEASAELLELGMLEYRKTMRDIAHGFDTGEWPAPVTEDYTDELNDFDLRRLEALRLA